MNDETPLADGFTITEPQAVRLPTGRAAPETGDPDVDRLLARLHDLTGVNIVPVERQPGVIHTVAFATHNGSLEESRTVETVTAVARTLAAKLVETANLIREAIDDTPPAPVPGLRFLSDDDLLDTAIMMISGITKPPDADLDAPEFGDLILDYLFRRLDPTTFPDTVTIDTAKLLPLVLVVDDPDADITTIDADHARALCDALAARFDEGP